MVGKGTGVPRSVFFLETAVIFICVLNFFSVNNFTHCCGQVQYS